MPLRQPDKQPDRKDLEGCVGPQSAERACVKRPTPDPQSGSGRPLGLIGPDRCPYCGEPFTDADYVINNPDGILSHESCVQEAASEDE